MTPKSGCRLLEFQVCWQLIPGTWCRNSKRSVANLAVGSWDDEVTYSNCLRFFCIHFNCNIAVNVYVYKSVTNEGVEHSPRFLKLKSH